MYLYSVYGLTVESDIELPELYPANGEAACVSIRQARVPDEVEDASFSGILYQAAPSAFRMALDGVVKLWVTNGSEIVVEKHPAASWDEVRIFLLGSGFGALLHQRGVLPLHAGAVRVNGGCVAFVGRSGMGKSTLTAALNRAGYPLVADDVLVLTQGDSGTTLAWPAYPELKIWADSARRLGVSTRTLRRLRTWKKKYSLPALESHCDQPLPLHRVYVLGLSDDDLVSMVPLEGAKKLEALMEHTYRVQYLEGLERKPHHFRLCAEVGQSTPVRLIHRPKRRFELKRLQKLVEEDWSR